MVASVRHLEVMAEERSVLLCVVQLRVYLLNLHRNAPVCCCVSIARDFSIKEVSVQQLDRLLFNLVRVVNVLVLLTEVLIGLIRRERDDSTQGACVVVVAMTRSLSMSTDLQWKLDRVLRITMLCSWQAM